MRVLKLGGSLYDLPDLPARLRTLVALLSGEPLLIFPGGGPTADLVRAWQPRFGFDDDAAHHLAVAALDLNARLLATLCPEWSLLSEPMTPSLRDAGPAVRILTPSRTLFRLEAEHPDIAPPSTWDVTSDSLAAWVAAAGGATELILAKSVPCPWGEPVTQAMQRGLVDPYFPGIAGRLPRVSWNDFRRDPLQVTAWLEDGARAASDTAICQPRAADSTNLIRSGIEQPAGDTAPTKLAVGTSPLRTARSGG